MLFHFSMRSPFACFLIALATLTIGTAALEASLFTFEPGLGGQDQGSLVVTNKILQQLLELRSGSSTTSALETSGGSSIEVLSRFGGASGTLFSAVTPVKDGELNTILVIVEGLSEHIDSLIRHEYQNGLLISAFPTVSERSDFFDSLLETSPSGLFGPESKRCSFNHGEITGIQKVTRSCPSQLQFGNALYDGLINGSITGEAWVNEPKGACFVHVSFKPLLNPKAAIAYVNTVKSLFSDLHSLSLNGTRTTAVILPISNNAQKSLYSRRTPGFDIDSIVDAARSTQSMTIEQRLKTPPSFAPVCYASNASCLEATNSCSGHGVCFKKSGPEGEGTSGDCYACRCYETYVKNEDGSERKVQWGGSACQKIDISSPFFLISGVAVAIIVTVISAISMIYSVGNTELPGVISAGVGTTRAQK
ncbi:hypothetical protein BJX61DRAFT_528552 [Aspergillus egyptiacus]|nr:hypothetical protein BJX61DRAFT_528552 [Aspergillus egyptiacus]